ncbi:hypothetical protein BKA93DRAFT_516481 [Sparassis latifolia]
MLTQRRPSSSDTRTTHSDEHPPSSARPHPVWSADEPITLSPEERSDYLLSNSPLARRSRTSRPDSPAPAYIPRTAPTYRAELDQLRPTHACSQESRADPLASHPGGILAKEVKARTREPLAGRAPGQRTQRPSAHAHPCACTPLPDPAPSYCWPLFTSGGRGASAALRQLWYRPQVSPTAPHPRREISACSALAPRRPLAIREIGCRVVGVAG